MSYVYKFLNSDREVIYVGITQNISRRLKEQHFTKNGHLPEKCYEECQSIEYAKVKSDNESRVYELYLISKYFPKYNVTFSTGGELSISLPDLSWVTWEIENKNRQLINGDEKLGEELLTQSKNILSMIKTMKVFDFDSLIDEKDKNRYFLVLDSIEDYTSRISEISKYYYPELE